MELNQVVSHLINNVNGEHIGIAGFDAYVWTEQRVSRQAQITELVLEDGSIASDHIALAPITLSIGGIVADDFFRSENRFQQMSFLLSEKGKIAGYLAARPRAVRTRADSVGEKGQSVFNQGNALYSYLMNGKGLGVGGLQQQFIDTFDAIFNDRKLITVDFGYQVYENMAIQAFETTLNNEFEAIIFTMNLMQVTFVEFEQIDVIQTKENQGKKSTAANNQSSKNSNKGKVSGKKQNEQNNVSILKDGINKGTGLFNRIMK